MCRGDLNARFCGEYRRLLSQNAILLICRYTYLLRTFAPFYLFIISFFRFIYYFRDFHFVFHTNGITSFQLFMLSLQPFCNDAANYFLEHRAT